MNPIGNFILVRMTYKTDINSIDEIDDEVINWLRAAYDFGK